MAYIPPANDIVDGCFKLSVASVLEMHPSRVPHFVKRHGSRWEANFLVWATRRKVRVECHTLHGRDDCPAPGFWIACVDYTCPACRANGEEEWRGRHALVMKGHRIFYDSSTCPLRYQWKTFDGYALVQK